ncbi:rho GTPase-activating protein 44 isoform X3 [Gadus morhua]|uniref:rho GTPase-activating protein 44 isoform X3 n=1 Tax=Gadus morhua TaxID=8049 RepID=UPI0011B6A751|nr:rho GTPase-activating protein 44-like isoform X3 [Gadus morhua]
MKKQFNRMRQLANQTVGRAEKTEPLSDDLLQVEKRLDLVKQVTHSTHKKLTACLQGQQGAEGEKRSVKSPSKKLPLTMLAQCLVEGAAVLGDDSLLGKMLTLCGETEESLAQELLQFEVQIERDVVEPLFVLAEVDIPNIQKQRKHLAKLVLDMDSSRTRFHQSSKSSSHPSTLQPGAKAESLREEMEEAANRMEICRDQLSADMFSFVAKEMDYSNYFQTLIEIQAEYHRKSLEILNSVLPQIKAQQEAWVEKPSFGKSLEDHLNISGREIAFPIEACVTMLLECGMQEEGLFRVAPSNSKLKKLKASLDCGVLDVLEYSADPHAIAGALKSYLRELPEPLMTTELYDEWIQASNLQDLEKRLQGLLCACEKLPTDNLNNFRYLIKFLSKLTEYQDANKMTPGNMAIVLGPNLLWTHTDANITEMMTTVSLQIVGIIEPIIQHADWFFPGDIEFNLTGCYGSPIHNNHNSNFSSMPSPDMDHTERRQQHDLGRRPLSVATDNMMLEFYKKDGMGVRVMDTSWVSRKGSSTLVRKTSSTPPGLQGGGLGPPADSLILEQPGELSTSPSATPPPPPPPPPPMGDPRLGTLKSKELSPVIGHKGIQVVGPTVPLSSCPPLGSQSPHSTEPSPHTLRKGSKKLAPGPPKVPYGGGVSDQSAGGQPSPVSLSPTPPSTPSPYGPACPPGPLMALGASPGGGQPPPPPGSGPYSLSSPPSLAGTLTKSRPGHSKPRQRPSLPPPQPPSAPPPDPELLEGLSPGESMSTDIFNYEIPPINVNLDSLIDEFSGAPCRRYMGYYMADSPEGDAVAEEEPQSTTL